jgi:hypothetical protein
MFSLVFLIIIINIYPEPELPTIATLCPDGTVNERLSRILCPST